MAGTKSHADGEHVSLVVATSWRHSITFEPWHISMRVSNAIVDVDLCPEEA